MCGGEESFIPHVSLPNLPVEEGAEKEDGHVSSRVYSVQETSSKKWTVLVQSVVPFPVFIHDSFTDFPVILSKILHDAVCAHPLNCLKRLCPPNTSASIF